MNALQSPGFSLLFHFTGTPNDRMFSDTPEVSQNVFTVLWKPACVIWNCSELKTMDPFGCLRGTWVVSKVLGGFIDSIKPLMGAIGISRNLSSCTSLSKY